MAALDIELLERAKADEDQALEAIARYALPLVLDWCARLGGPKVDHEDAAHDVMIVALRRVGSVHGPEQFDSWLFSITRRVLAAHRRKAWVRRWVPGASVERIDRHDGPAHRYESTETINKVRQALDGLTPHQREVLVLCDLEGRTAMEAGTIIGIPTGTVKSRLRLGRAAFHAAATRLGLADLVLEQR